MAKKESKEYDIVIIGGGIVGAALLYVLAKYTNLTSIALVEKYPKLGQVNTSSRNNSQTLHFGDIETNYTLEKAKAVKQAADMLVKYLESSRNERSDVFRKSHKMALAVGDEEVRILDQRFKKFRGLFPNLKKLDREAIAQIEPEVVRGRNPKESILALYSEDGYIVDYGKLAESFVENAKRVGGKNIDLFLNTKVNGITKKESGYEVATRNLVLHSRVVVVAAGSHSLLFAKSLGYGQNYLLLPVIGNFYCSTCKILNGKVYTMQQEKLPFAAVHGDPNINNLAETRFGPTAKVMPILERRNIATFFDFLKSVGLFDRKAVISLVTILSDPVIFKFIIKNFIYDLPFIGKIIFLKTVKKIVPTINSKNCVFGKGLGGIRPQLVDKKQKKILFGVGEIIGDNIIFNITPSPGASASLQNAENIAQKVITFLKGDFEFDKKSFKNDFK